MDGNSSDYSSLFASPTSIEDFADDLAAGFPAATALDATGDQRISEALRGRGLMVDRLHSAASRSRYDLILYTSQSKDGMVLDRGTIDRLCGLGDCILLLLPSVSTPGDVSAKSHHVALFARNGLFRDFDYDSPLDHHALCFRKLAGPEELVYAAYEHHVGELERELSALRLVCAEYQTTIKTHRSDHSPLLRPFLSFARDVQTLRDKVAPAATRRDLASAFLGRSAHRLVRGAIGALDLHYLAMVRVRSLLSSFAKKDYSRWDEDL